MNCQFAYAVGFHPWGDAKSDPPGSGRRWRITAKGFERAEPAATPTAKDGNQPFRLNRTQEVAFPRPAGRNLAVEHLRDLLGEQREQNRQRVAVGQVLVKNGRLQASGSEATGIRPATPGCRDGRSRRETKGSHMQAFRVWS